MTKPAEISGRPIYDTMLRYFESEEWPITVHEDESAIVTGFTGRNGSWSCLAKALDQHNCFILLSSLETNVPEGKRIAMAEFLTRANFGIYIGNFDMDFSDGEVRFKTSVDMADGELTLDMVKLMTNVSLGVMDEFLPGLMAVISGGKTPEQAIALVRQQH